MLFPAWESFYVIVGSAAGALTGLMFVVVALVTDLRRNQYSGESFDRQLGAFATPTVMHFCATLLLSAIEAAPWPAIAPMRIALAAVGVTGVAYMIVVVLRARRQTDYAPVFEDWLFHCALPGVAYGATAVAAVMLARSTTAALFIVGIVVVLLLFIGIHNAWDTVIYVVTTRANRSADTKE
jgi:hypothetical protein